ncbi:hypothetical protein L3i20_v248700 [Paenibacillus sp. L3-i20]|nr:hypothetical protein L3i20_v248700 [Paenibacillus sp. L3-i20]
MREKSTIGIKHKSEVEITALQETLLRYCLMLTRSIEDAKDLSQDTWVRAVGNLMVWNHVNPEAFLLRIAKNRWIDLCRRKTILMDRLSRMYEPDVEQESCTLEVQSIFQSILHYQSPLQRSVFILREVLGYSIEETAKLLETTEGAVKSALYRARQTLEGIRKELLEEGAEPAQQADHIQHLQQLVAAYSHGDVDALIRLLQRDHSAPAVITAIGYSMPSIRASHTYTTHSQFTMSMSA